MVSIKEQLIEDQKEAMRQREAGKSRLGVIRMVRAAIRNAEIAKGGELGDEEVVEVIAREAKQKRETLEAFRDAGRQEKAAELEKEFEILESYLPRQLTEAELRDLVAGTITRVGASGPSDMGKVMGAIMPQVRGRADGSTVSRIVRELLQE